MPVDYENSIKPNSYVTTKIDLPRLFAAMNPATDVGKRNLPEGVQNRFTEIFVDEPTECSDIATIVAYYLNKRTVSVKV